MKKLYLLMLITLFSLPVMADEAAQSNDVVVTENSDIVQPEALKGGVVTVHTAKGDTTVSSDEYAIVKRKQNGPKKVTITHTEKEESLKNSIKVFGGVGRDGASVTAVPGGYSVGQNYGVNFGVGYEREVAKHWQIEIDGFGSPTGFNAALLGVGYKF